MLYSRKNHLVSLIAAQLLLVGSTNNNVALAWMPAALVHTRARSSYTSSSTGNTIQTGSPVILSLSSSNNNSEDNKSDDADQQQYDRTSFDQAGASLIEEEDRKRMEQMGDFDSNESYQEDSIAKMRAAIRERTAGLGIEKSKVTAEYIAQRERSAKEAGPPGVAAQNDPNAFGGLDLSQISDRKQTTSSWDEDMPSMFYDPEDDLSKEEQEEVDPVMLKNPIEQGLNELANAKWPDMFSALREVAIMFVVIAFTTVIITSWDTLLRGVYTGFGFIPTADDIANYASRFDGLDLPDGWTGGMSDVDVQTYGDTISSSDSSGMPEL